MKNLRIKALIACAACVISVTGAYAQNYKIKQKMSINGQSSESTIYVKGARQRSESSGMMGMGADVATIEQCDLKRNVEVSDNKKLYFVEPFSDDSSDGNTATADSSNQKPKSKIPNQKGGTVTLSYNIADTGERKQMFGLTARHVKTSMTMQASPDACSDADMRVETDGWYVDLPQFSCPVKLPKNPFAAMNAANGGCQDKFVSKQSGAGKLGFPLTETRTMQMGGDAMNFTQSIETLEFSNATLDAALFDVPKNYTLAKSSQDLYGEPDMSQMMKTGGAMTGGDENSMTPAKSNQVSTAGNSPAPAAKKAGTTRIGVLAVSNHSGEAIESENLRAFLIEKLSNENVEAVAVNSESDAKTKSCDYVLTTDISKLKQSTAAKIGGMFGKVTGTDTSSAQKYEAQIDFKLTDSGGQMILQNKAAQKSDGNAETVVELALAQAAQAVLSKAKTN